MNGITDARIFIARHTMCTSVIPFIRSLLYKKVCVGYSIHTLHETTTFSFQFLNTTLIRSYYFCPLSFFWESLQEYHVFQVIQLSIEVLYICRNQYKRGTCLYSRCPRPVSQSNFHHSEVYCRYNTCGFLYCLDFDILMNRFLLQNSSYKV